MKRAFIKYSKDNKSFNFFKLIGENVIELENPENVDKEMERLCKSNCKTIIITNEIADFSEDIIKKYTTSKDISIIITRGDRSKNDTL